MLGAPDLRGERSGLRRVWPWLVVLAMATLLTVDLVRVWRITNHHDLDVFLLAANRLAEGGDIYADAAPFQALIESGTFSMKDASVVWPYVYPPLIALLFVPLRSLSPTLVQGAWWTVNLMVLLLGALCCLRAHGPLRPLGVAAVLLLLYRFEPAVAALRLGQIEIIQFALLSLTLYSLSRGREGLGGACLGLATALKFFPGALVGFLIWRRRWLAAGWALVVALAAIVGSFALVGFEVLPRYLSYTSAYGIGGTFAAFPYNQSLNGFFSRNLMANAFVVPLKGWDRPGLAKALTLLGDAVIVGLSAWLTWHRHGWRRPADRQATRRFAQEYALAVVALLLVSPHSQVYALVWVLITFIVLPMVGIPLPWAEDAHISWWRRIAPWLPYLAAYALLGRDFRLIRPGWTRLVQSHYLFGALLLWGVTALALFAGGRQRASRSLPIGEAAVPEPLIGAKG